MKEASMSRFDRNYTEEGYLMNYETPEMIASLKRQVLQFRIELEDIEPAIWRRIQVSSDCNFWDLHVALQDAMGWLDYHLHHFEIKGKHKRNTVHIGIPDFDRFGGIQEVLPGWEIPVINHFNDLGVTARYHYDYGDSWVHIVKLEGYIFREKKQKYPCCTGGARACPREDCGGPPGYMDMIETLSDPENEDYEDMRIWADDWHQERFDREDIKFDNPYRRWVYAFLRK